MKRTLPEGFAFEADLVAIGASAGGIDALFALLQDLRAPLAGAVAIVLHLPEDHESRLAEVFGNRLQVPVQEAQAHQPIQPGWVYFAPPGYHLLVEADRSFSLSCDPPVLFSRPSIDVFFESCADAIGERLLGIVLTGANEDGARGLARIKALAASRPCRTRPRRPIRPCRKPPCASPGPFPSVTGRPGWPAANCASPMTEPSTDVNVLLVDDLRENLVALEALLRQPGRRIFTARSGEEALSLMLEHAFALAILDVQMPSMNGFELAELMRGTERTRHIPIVFVSAAGRELNYAFRGYESGAVDFLYKPIDPIAVRSKVNVFVELFRQRQELQAAQEQLQRAVNMRDDFMSMVSHELRNPLNSVYLQTQLRRRMLESPTPPDPDTMLKMVERDERQIRSMVRLLDDMLDVSRARTGRLAMSPAPFDLAASARAVVEAIEEQASSDGVTITLAAPESLPMEGDEFRIEQVITNLLTNALRYGQGKPVAVALGTREEEKEAFVSVRDQGMGIAPADQERIFEQFERTASAEQVAGLGLGLFIARQIAQAHQGRLEVRSATGEGAEFVLSLPLPARQAT